MSTSTSPAKKGKAPATTVSKNVKFSTMLRDGKPKASTSASAINEDDDDDEMANQDLEGDDDDSAEWQTKQPSGATEAAAANNDNDDDEDAVMIDSQSLLPPSSTTTSAPANAAESSQQGLLAFPALSAKEAQGKIETQTRKIAVCVISLLWCVPCQWAESDFAISTDPSA